MSIEEFESISMIVGLGGLISFMFFIIYDLGKKSNAGKFGMLILFMGLGLGMVGFLIKTVLVELMEF